MAMKPNTKLFFCVTFVAVLAWGIFARFWGVSDRGFWMDEASVANVIVQRPALELFLQTDVPVAPAFALVAKMTGLVISPPEIGLRLFPMVFGVACIPLFYLLMRTLRFTPFTSLIAMTLSASCPFLLIWSRELKPYVIEAFFSILLALLVFKIRRCPSTKKRSYIAVAIVTVSILGPWFGYGFIFPAVTLLVVLMLLSPVHGSRQFMVKVGVIGLLGFILSFGILWFLIASEQAGREGTQHYNNLWFIEATSLRSWAKAICYGLICGQTIISPACLQLVRREKAVIFASIGLVIWVISLLGLWLLPKKIKIEVAAWMIVPWLMLLIAALMKKYPFGSIRLSVLLAPAMIVGFAYGMISILRFICKSLTGYSGVGVFISLILSLVPIFYMVKVPLENSYYWNHDFREVLPTLYENHKDDEDVVVSIHAVHSVKFSAKEKGENFIYMPCAGYTPSPVVGFDYIEFARDILKNTGKRWWLLTTTSKDTHCEKLLQEARRQGYRFKSYAPAKGNEEYGYAVLFLVERGW